MIEKSNLKIIDSFDEEVVETKKEVFKEITGEEYNQILIDEGASAFKSIHSDKGNTFSLLNGDIMVRLFKTTTKSNGIILPNIRLVPSESGERLVPTFDNSELADFIPRGIVVATSDKCTSGVKQGDIIDLKAIRSLGEHNYKFDQSKNSPFENYFIFPEQYIRLIWK